MINLRYDFQGWPMNALTFKELLNDLGFTPENGAITIPEGHPLLHAYPSILMDDGMGYGIHEGYVVEGDTYVYKRKIGKEPIKTFNIFIEPQPIENEDEEDDTTTHEFKAGDFLYGIPETEEDDEVPEYQHIFIYDGHTTADGYGKLIGYEDGKLKRSTGYGNFQWGGDVRPATPEEITEFIQKL